MNRLEARRKFCHLTGRHDLVVNYATGDYTDNGADYFLDEGMEYLDLMYGFLKPVREERFLTTGGSLLIPELKQLISARWKDADGEITDLIVKLTLSELEEIYEDPLEEDEDDTPAHILMYNHTSNRQERVEAELDAITELYQVVRGKQFFLGAYLKSGTIRLGAWLNTGVKSTVTEQVITGIPHSMFIHNELVYYVISTGVRVRDYVGVFIDDLVPGGTPYIALDALNNRLIVSNATHIQWYNLDLSGGTNLFALPANSTYLAVMGNYLYIYNSVTFGISKYTMTGTLVKTLARMGQNVNEMSASNGKLYVSVDVDHEIQIFDEDLNLLKVEYALDAGEGVATHIKASGGYLHYWKEGEEVEDEILFYAYTELVTSARYNVVVVPPASETGTLILKGAYKEIIDSGADDFTNYWLDLHSRVTILAAQRELMIEAQNVAGEKIKTEAIENYMAAFDMDRLSEELDMTKPVTIEG